MAFSLSPPPPTNTLISKGELAVIIELVNNRPVCHRDMTFVIKIRHQGTRRRPEFCPVEPWGDPSGNGS